MFFKVKTFIFVILFTFVFLSDAMAQNPGKSADYCVRQMENIVVNYCPEKVFIFWCGDILDSDKKCGNGPKGSYYTHSTNLAPGQTENIKIKLRGDFAFGTCFGSTAFGNEKEYIDTPEGDYKCLAQ